MLGQFQYCHTRWFFLMMMRLLKKDEQQEQSHLICIRPWRIAQKDQIYRVLVGRRTNHRLICWCDKQLYKCFREHQQICDLKLVKKWLNNRTHPFFVNVSVSRKWFWFLSCLIFLPPCWSAKKMKLFSQILAMLFDVLTSLLLVLKQNGLKFLGCLIDALHTLSYVRKIPAWKIC